MGNLAQMFKVITITLILLTHNTWTGKQLDQYKDTWEVYVPLHGDIRMYLIQAIEKCRVRGVKKAYKMSEDNPNQHSSTNVNCRYEFGQGT